MTATPSSTIELTEVATLPEIGRPQHIFGTNAWLRAWERTTIERTLASRCLWREDLGQAIPYHHVERSPFWSAYEREAGVADVWRRSVVYAPSLYSIYGPAPETPTAIDAAVDAGLELVEAWGARALVFVNVEDPCAQRWMAHRRPAAALVLDIAHRSAVAASLDDQLAGLRSHVRRELRRQWRRSRERGLSLLVLREAQMRPRLGEFQALASATSERHSGDLYDLETFEALADVPGATLLLAERAGEAHGGFLCFGYADRLYLWTAGIAYESLRELGTYGFLFVESIAHAIDEGRRVIEAGRGNSAYKVRHGFGAGKLWTLVYLDEAGDRTLERRLGAMRRGLLRHLGV